MSGSPGVPWAILVAFCVAGPACAPAPVPPPPEPPLRVLVRSPLSTLDPQLTNDFTTSGVLEAIYEPLVAVDDRLRPLPALAQSWRTPSNEWWRFELREGVRFHDGRELTSADVVYTFSSFLDPAFLSPRKGAYRVLAAVEAVDRYTVDFVLTEPFGSFPINLVMGIVQEGADEVSSRPVGTGPYAFVKSVPDDRVELVRFDEHFGGPAENAGLVLKVVPDDTMRGLELRKGTVDLVVNDLAPDIVHQLQREDRLQTATAPGADYAYVGLNLRDPILQDVRVRRALAHAVDRSAIIEHLRRGLATPAVGILPPMSWAFDAGIAEFDHDPAAAARLLDEAGFPDPDGDGPGTRFRLTIKTSTAEFVRLQAAVLQQQWQRVGVGVDVRSYEFATLYADVLRGNFQAFTLQWVGVSDPDMLRRAFHSAQMPPAGFNRGFFADPEVDRLVEVATRSVDDAERRRLYGEAQRRIATQVPYISLWYKTNVAVFQPDIEGVQLTPTADFSTLRFVRKTPPAS